MLEMTVRDQPRDHVAQFYEHDADLVGPVAAFVAVALRSGDVAIVVATVQHLRSIEAELELSGFDVGAARANGNLITLDAVESLNRLLLDGALDADAFDETFGALIREASRRASRVRVFGEMVDLLLDSGQVEGVMELEALWNRLGHEVPFSLYCAYCTLPEGKRLDEARSDICQLHSAVVGHDGWHPAVPIRPTTAEAVRPFPLAAGTLAEVRRFVAEVLERWDHDDVLADACVVVTELAANAVRHARSPFVIALSEHPGMVRLAVQDDSPSVPVVAPAPGLASGGRGLRLVSALADRWGTDPAGDGKVVWAELPL